MSESSKSLVQNESDGEAYHEMASAAVDLKNIFVRRGVVSGE